MRLDLSGVRTNHGKTRAATLEAGEVTQLSVGRGTTEPTEGDTALVDEVMKVAVTSTVRPTPGLVRHSGRLGVGDANGETLREWGLHDAGGDLLARAVTIPLDKSVDFEFGYKIRSRWGNPT